jgi:hypothetical protein
MWAGLTVRSGVVERIDFWKASRRAWMGYERCQVPVGFLGAGLVA